MEVDYVPDEGGVEVLNYQIYSLLDLSPGEEIVLVDQFGRELSSNQDIEEIASLGGNVVHAEQSGNDGAAILKGVICESNTANGGAELTGHRGDQRVADI